MASGTEEVTISVKTAKQKIDIKINGDAKVKDFKVAVKAHFEDADLSQLCLIYSGKILKDEETLKQHGIRHGSSIHLVIRQSKPAQSSAPSSQPTAAGTSTSNSTPSTTTPSPPGAAMATGPTPPPHPGMPFMGMGGSLQDQMTQFQRQIAANPELMTQLLNNPMMQNMLNSPDMLSGLLQSNPQMRELMERNPELGHIMNNPDMMRQVLEMMRNPAVFQEMLRSHDRQLSNIESMPGGFNALARMYTEIQEPMMDAAQETLQQQQQQNPFAALFGGSSQGATPPGPSTPQGAPNTNPLPNPWAPSSSSAPSTSPGTSPQPTATTTTAAGSTNSTQSPFASMFGLGGMGGMGGMGALGGMGNPALQNPEILAQMLQNPAYQQMMQQMMSNPQLMEQILMNSPMLQGNPLAQERARHMAQMMQNEEFRRMMTNPEYLRAMSNVMTGMQQLQNLGGMPQGMGMFGGLGAAAPPGGGAANTSTTSPSTTTTTTQSSSATTGTTSASSTAPTNTQPSASNQPSGSLGMDALSQAIRQAYQQQGGGGETPSLGPQTTPMQPGGDEMSLERQQLQTAERTYSSQLAELQAMGFSNRQANLRALIDTGGDLNAAVNILLR